MTNKQSSKNQCILTERSNNPTITLHNVTVMQRETTFVVKFQ